MKLNEIEKLTDKELGEKIADFIGYKTNSIYWIICETFASDLNSISDVEQILREKALNKDSQIFLEYGRCIFRKAISYRSYDDTHVKIKSDSPIEFAMIATITARQRAEACLFVLSNYDDKDDNPESVEGDASADRAG